MEEELNKLKSEELNETGNAADAGNSDKPSDPAAQEDGALRNRNKREGRAVQGSSNKKHFIKNEIAREIVGWSATIIAAVFIAIIINTYFFRISRVSGTSMLQTYQNGEIVYISRAPYIFGSPKKNDIVIFDSEFKPRNFWVEIKEAFKYNVISYKLFDVNQPTNYFIKRVIAVGGDTLRIDGTGVYVNGSKIEEPYVYVNPDEDLKLVGGSRGYSVDTLAEGITVPEGKVFVMGDNRNHSTDSRLIGCVPEEDIIGKVIGG